MRRLLALALLLSTAAAGRKKGQGSSPASVLKRLRSRLARLEQLPPCELPQIDAREVSVEEFRARHQERRASLILNGTPQWAAAMSSWTAENVSAQHGDLVVALQDPELLVKRGSFAPVIARRVLSEYIENLDKEPVPVFWNRWMDVTERLVGDLGGGAAGGALAGLPTRSLRFNHIFSLGGAGTGVGFHAHSENWLGQVAGRKAWFVAPPDASRPSEKRHGCEWLLGAAAKEPHVQTCVVEPGQAIYVPTAWHHATCNLDAFTLSLGGQGDIGDAEPIHDAVLDSLAEDEVARVAAQSEDNTARIHTGQAAWHLAIMHNRVPALRALRSAGVDITAPMNCDTSEARTPAYRREWKGAQLATCLLLGGSPWFRGSGPGGMSPFYLATQYGTLDVVKYFVEEVGVPIGSTMPVDGGVINIAHAACAYADPAILSYALRVDPTVLGLADASGRLPIHWCAFQGAAELVEKMMEHSTPAQLAARDGRGSTPEALSMMMVQQARAHPEISANGLMLREHERALRALRRKSGA